RNRASLHFPVFFPSFSYRLFNVLGHFYHSRIPAFYSRIYTHAAAVKDGGPPQLRPLENEVQVGVEPRENPPDELRVVVHVYVRADGGDYPHVLVSGRLE